MLDLRLPKLNFIIPSQSIDSQINDAIRIIAKIRNLQMICIYLRGGKVITVMKKNEILLWKSFPGMIKK